MGDLFERPQFDYVAFKSCGCVVGLCADVPGEQTFTSKEVARWISKGLIVERKSIDNVKILLDRNGFGCTCNEENQQISLLDTEKTS